MNDHDAMYQRFLDQLHALEEFRQVHAELNPSAAVDRDDPAVRRVVEALALFSARTQAAARDNLRASLDRVLAGYFDFLLAPMPSVATVQASGAERLIEATTLPDACEVAIAAGETAIARFATLSETPLLPARLEASEVQLRPDGFRLLVSLRALAPVRALAGPITLHVNHLDRFASSLRLFHNLRRHLRATAAFFEARPGAEDRGVACVASFGPRAGGLLEALNPLERLRLVLHHPELELYLHVTIPAEHRPWTRLVLAFDLDASWPDSRAIAAEPLHLHALPVINLVHAPAATLTVDGTKSEHPIVPHEAHRDTSLRAVTGVFELGPNGLSPLPTDTLPGAAEGYEIARVAGPRGLHQRLRLRLRDAFKVPRKVVVQAEWHQPWFAARAVGPLQAWLPNRHLDALKWRVLGGVRPARESPLDEMSSGLFELLALRMRPTLRRDDLIRLLQLLGASGESPFAAVLQQLRAVDVEVARDGGTLDGARHRYRLRFAPIAPADEALVATLATRVRELCEAWSEATVVAVDVEVSTETDAARAGAVAKVHQ